MKTKEIKIGRLRIGGAQAVAVQTMWKEKLTSLDGVVEKIESLKQLGCGILRFAVPDIDTAEILGALSKMTDMPLAADIHFDYKIALRCLDFPIAKIRINPGNIGGRDKTAAVLDKASSLGIPVRIGVNAGSLPSDLRSQVEKGSLSTVQALVEAAQREISIFEEFGFDNYLVSIKTCQIADTIEANKILAQRTDEPLHLGVTEAGPLAAGVASSAAALVPLLSRGIGDTIRVSLSDTMENEVIAGREIIRAAYSLAAAELAAGSGVLPERLKSGGVKIVSCPRCGRYGFDTHGFTSRMLAKLYAIQKDITVAIMGCEVNGPAEAKHADIGITGAGDKVMVFKRGQVIKTTGAGEAEKIFEEELNKL